MGSMDGELRIIQSHGDARERLEHVRALADSLSKEALAEVAESMAVQDIQNVGAEVVTAYFGGRSLAHADWAAEFEDWLYGASLNDETQLKVISDVAWAARSNAASALLSVRPEGLSSPELDSRRRLIRACLYLQSARFDYKFDLIIRSLHLLGEDFTQSSEYLQAVREFAAMGRNDQVSMDVVRRLAESAQDPKVLHLLLHGLWFTTGREQAELMLEISDRLISIDPRDSVAMMRRAAAHRRLGRYREALGTIDNAIAQLSPERLDVHRDYVGERSLITMQEESEQRLREVAASLEAELQHAIEGQASRYRDDLQAQGEESRRQTADALFKVVEILGLFTALIAILATVVTSSVVGGILWWQRVLILATGGAISIGFFWLLRLIVHPAERRP